MMLQLLAALAVKAAVSQVTIFGDRARIVRAGDVDVSGRTRIELPLLPDSVDAESIRVEAEGAEVQKVDIQHVQPDEFPVGEARELLGKLDSYDDQLRRLADERMELAQHLAALRKIAPVVPEEPLRPRPKLNAAAWSQALGFVQTEEESIQAQLRDRAIKSDFLMRERQPIAERARIVGGAGRRSGWRVSADLEGRGAAHVEVTYMAAQARWTPSYDLQLLPDQKTVRVAFSGEASQQTGEDWDGASFTLSTALPATARALPEIATWKIGEKERFIPTPDRAMHQPPPPPPSPLPVQPMRSEADELRQTLLARAQAQPPQAPAAEPQSEAEADAMRAPALAGLALPGPAEAKMAPAPQYAPEPPPVKREASRRRRPEPAPTTAAAPPAGASANVAERRLPPADQVGIAPPPSWQRPYTPPDSPSALAGGYDLEFASVRRETLRTGGPTRRVLLFSESWPVATERLLFPALTPDTYLVAQIKNPSDRTMPRGHASLAVGADPSGTAELPLVAPGEEFTLPLGIDRAVRSFRNIAQVQSEKGLFSKDEITRYAVTIEVANPYAVPIPLRVVDQLPLPGDKNIEVSLVEAKGAERDEGTGKLTWKVQAPASGKVKLAFVYELKRPKGYRVHQ